MAARYTPISVSEVAEVLPESRGWRSGVKHHERVFWRPLEHAPHVVVAVYSSCGVDADTGRDCGQDAIRVTVIDTKAQRPILRKLPRVHRTQNWRTNLRARVLEAMQAAYRVLRLNVNVHAGGQQ